MSRNKSYLILEDDRFNFDYLHFLPFHKGQCSKYHGHSSTISVVLEGTLTKQGMIVDFSEAKDIIKRSLNIVDHKTIAPISSVKHFTNGYLDISFNGISGFHSMKLPEKAVCVISTDSTVENVSKLLADNILKNMPKNVTRVIVRMNEGIGKSAASIASIYEQNTTGYIIYSSSQVKNLIEYPIVADTMIAKKFKGVVKLFDKVFSTKPLR